MKKCLLIATLILILTLLVLIPNTLSVTIDTNVHFEIDNETYTVTTSLDFSMIQIADTYIGFNDTYFNVSAPNDIWINLTYLDDDIANLAAGNEALDFNTFMSSGTAYFNISGFTNGHIYDIKRGGTTFTTETANTSGVISFNNNVWSEQHIEINKQEGLTLVDVDTFGGEVEVMVENNIPTFSNEAPTNNTVGLARTPSVYVMVTDADAEATTCNFYTSPDGSVYTWRQTNLSVASGENISYIYTGADSWNTKYYWRIFANDGTDNSSDTYDFTTNHIPSYISHSPGNGSTGVSLTPQVFIDIDDPDADPGSLSVSFFNSSDGTTYYFQQFSDGHDHDELVSWFPSGYVGHTEYWWKVFIDDGISNVSYWFSFTTLNDPPTIVDTYPANNSNDISVNIPYFFFNASDGDGDYMNTSCKIIIEGCGQTYLNPSAFQDGMVSILVNSGACLPLDYDTTYTWYINLTDDYTYINETFSFTTAADVSVRASTDIFNYWFSCGNASVRTPTLIFDYWFSCGNISQRSSTLVFDYWFSCGNASVRTPTLIFDYWFDCGNTSARTSTEVFNYWFNCSNVTEVKASELIFDYWFSCGNVSARGSTEIFNYWFGCGNGSIRGSTEFFNYWFNCSNVTAGRSPTLIFDYWFGCGNASVRTPTLIFDYWFGCGNTSQRSSTLIFDYWFDCGNVSVRASTEVFNYWFNCSNVTAGRSPTLVFDYWFSCGNVSFEFIIISDIYPSDGSTRIHLQPTLYLMINHTQGLTINVTWYVGTNQTNVTTLIGTNISISNNTIHTRYIQAIANYTTYYWRINATDGTNSVNYTYSFTTVKKQLLLITIPSGMNPLIFLLIGALGLFGILGFRKRRSRPPPQQIVYRRKQY